MVQRIPVLFYAQHIELSFLFSLLPRTVLRLTEESFPRNDALPRLSCLFSVLTAYSTVLEGHEI